MAYFTVDRELVDPDFHDGVVRSFQDDLPLQTIVGRIKAPIDITQDVEVEALPQVYDPSVAEGASYDPSGALKKLNPVMTEVIEQFRSKGWRVSRLRQKLPGHNEKKGQTAANKRAADARDLAINIERVLSSDQEAATYAATSGKPLTRGLMNWLRKYSGDPTSAGTYESVAAAVAAARAAVHAVYPLEGFLHPVAGFEGDTANLTEAVFKAELQKAKIQVGGSNLKLVGLVGTYLKGIMSEWLAKATTTQGVDNTLRATRSADTKKIQLIVDDFVYDGVTLHVLCDDNLLADTTTFAMQDASYRSGAFIRPEMWGVATLEPITHYEIEDDGAGPGGYHDASLRLTCLNPMGQLRVVHSA